MSLNTASEALDSAKEITERGLDFLRSHSNPEEQQVFLYDLSHTSSAIAIAESFLSFAEKGEEEKGIVELFCADTLRAVAAMCFGREDIWRLESSTLGVLNQYVAEHGTPQKYSIASLSSQKSHLSDELELVAKTFRRFGKDHIEHLAEEVHRKDLDVPEEIIAGLAQMGCFGLSIPEEYGGSASGSIKDMYGMAVSYTRLTLPTNREV